MICDVVLGKRRTHIISILCVFHPKKKDRVLKWIQNDNDSLKASSYRKVTWLPKKYREEIKGGNILYDPLFGRFWIGILDELMFRTQ